MGGEGLGYENRQALAEREFVGGKKKGLRDDLQTFFPSRGIKFQL